MRKKSCKKKFNNNNKDSIPNTEEFTLLGFKFFFPDLHLVINIAFQRNLMILIFA